VNSELHAPAALLAESTPARFEIQSGWALEPFGHLGKKKNLFSLRGSNPGPLSPWPGCYKAALLRLLYIKTQQILWN